MKSIEVDRAGRDQVTTLAIAGRTIHRAPPRAIVTLLGRDFDPKVAMISPRDAPPYYVFADGDTEPVMGRQPSPPERDR